MDFPPGKHFGALPSDRTSSLRRSLEPMVSKTHFTLSWHFERSDQNNLIHLIHNPGYVQACVNLPLFCSETDRPLRCRHIYFQRGKVRSERWNFRLTGTNRYVVGIQIEIIMQCFKKRVLITDWINNASKYRNIFYRIYEALKWVYLILRFIYHDFKVRFPVHFLFYSVVLSHKHKARGGR